MLNKNQSNSVRRRTAVLPSSIEISNDDEGKIDKCLYLLGKRYCLKYVVVWIKTI